MREDSNPIPVELPVTTATFSSPCRMCIVGYTEGNYIKSVATNT